MIVLLTSILALGAASFVIYQLAANDVITLNGQSQGILFILVIGAATDYSLLLVVAVPRGAAPHRVPGRCDARDAAGHGRGDPGLGRHGDPGRDDPRALRAELQPGARAGGRGRDRVRDARVADVPARGPGHARSQGVLAGPPEARPHPPAVPGHRVLGAGGGHRGPQAARRAARLLGRPAGPVRVRAHVQGRGGAPVGLLPGVRGVDRGPGRARPALPGRVGQRDDRDRPCGADRRDDRCDHRQRGRRLRRPPGGWPARPRRPAAGRGRQRPAAGDAGRPGGLRGRRGDRAGAALGPRCGEHARRWSVARRRSSSTRRRPPSATCG